MSSMRTDMDMVHQVKDEIEELRENIDRIEVQRSTQRKNHLLQQVCILIRTLVSQCGKTYCFFCTWVLLLMQNEWGKVLWMGWNKWEIIKSFSSFFFPWSQWVFSTEGEKIENKVFAQLPLCKHRLGRQKKEREIDRWGEDLCAPNGKGRATIHWRWTCVSLSVGT